MKPGDGTTRWVRFELDGVPSFGTLDDRRITAHDGELFGESRPNGRSHALEEVRLLMPCRPGKVIALWNNFAALGAKLNLAVPPEPLYFLKSPNSYANPGDVIRKPAADGKIVFEGELGIVIGRTASAVSEADAPGCVFGYTCANDVTHADILHRDASFAQWVRAKGFDTFCPLGPAIATGVDPSTLVVKTTLDGQLRQDYPISDMRFPVARLVSLISADMTLSPGDVILCGTSIGVGSMKSGSVVEVSIDGIGTLRNTFV